MSRATAFAMPGKALVVCMTRRNCVRLYDALTALPGCPEVKVVMTGKVGEDPQAWNEAGHLTSKAEREALKQRMIDPDDPLQIALVCDMWLTGTDIPCLHTLYVDKPMRGHNIIQAISRVNRVFRDKPHGMIVDYIGIGEDLRQAAAAYTAGGHGDPAPDLEDEAKRKFLECLEAVRAQMPGERDWGAWRELSRIELEDLTAGVFAHFTETDDRRDGFLDAEHGLTLAFLVVKHLDDCRLHADEIIFYQRVRGELLKTASGRKAGAEVERAVRDLVDDSLATGERVIDIFAASGLGKADVSILDTDFLQTHKGKKASNLRLKLLAKLLNDEIERRKGSNVAQYRSFRELLEKTLADYHKRVIDAAEVVRTMVQIRQEMESLHTRAVELGLSEEELAFYDAVAQGAEGIYRDKFLCDLVHAVVQSVKRNLKSDWNRPFRKNVKAGVQAAVRRVLRQNKVKRADFEPFFERIMEQAEAQYADWPLVA